MENRVLVVWLGLVGEENSGGGEEGGGETALLEELGSDERGVTLIAKERLGAETFEIAVPLRVFGAQGIEGVGGEGGEELEV